MDKGDPVDSLNHCCTCTEDPRPSAGSRGLANVIYSASRDQPEDHPTSERLEVERGSKNTSNTVVHTEHEIRLERQDDSQELANIKAEARFKYLREDWNDEAMRDLTQEVNKLSLSKERVKVVLQHTQDKRLTCAQLNDLMKLVALEAHKEQVLFERYPHLKDRSSFETEVVNAFSLSKSIRASLMRKLTKFLISQPSPSQVPLAKSEGSFALSYRQQIYNNDMGVDDNIEEAYKTANIDI